MVALLLACNLAGVKQPTEKAVSDMLASLKVPGGYYLWGIGTTTQTFEYSAKVRSKLGLSGSLKGQMVTGRVSFGTWRKDQPRSSMKGYPGMLEVHIAVFSSHDGAQTEAMHEASGFDRQSLKPYPTGTITGRPVNAAAWHFWSPSGPPASLLLYSKNVYVKASLQPTSKPSGGGTGFRKMTLDDARLLEDTAINVLKSGVALSN